MNIRKYFLCVVLSVITLSLPLTLSAQSKKNGKVSIPIEKGGVEKGRFKHGLREGVWKSYNAKGDLIQEERFVNGKRDGAMTRREDSTEITGNYKAGRKDGTFITKINGRVVREINYSMDTLNGKYFIHTAEKKVDGTYYRGKKNGLWLVDSIDYQKKRVRDNTSYANGLRHGLSEIYINTVLVSRTNWSDGKRNGEYAAFDEQTGLIITKGAYLNGERDGLWSGYENGKLHSVEDYENGIHAANSITYGMDTSIVLLLETYYPDGAKKTLQQNDESGKLLHRWYYSPYDNVDSVISYYPNGKIKSGQYTAYVNEDGFTQFYLYMSYHPNGKLETRGFEFRGSRNGIWLSYDSTGKPTANVHYAENVPFGWFKAYHPNGQLKLKAYCYEAITDTILVYSRTGERIAQNNPAYSKTIEEVQRLHPDIKFRDPNKFPPDHRKKGKVSLGDPVKEEGIWSEEPPTFPGGSDSLHVFIQRHVHYPEPERRLGFEGVVVIKFLVEKDGTLSDIQVSQAVKDAPGFTKETLKMMRKMPKWTPAKSKGKIVRVYYQLPVKFSLQ